MWVIRYTTVHMVVIRQNNGQSSPPWSVQHLGGNASTTWISKSKAKAALPHHDCTVSHCDDRNHIMNMNEYTDIRLVSKLWMILACFQPARYTCSIEVRRTIKGDFLKRHWSQHVAQAKQSCLRWNLSFEVISRICSFGLSLSFLRCRHWGCSQRLLLAFLSQSVVEHSFGLKMWTADAQRESVSWRADVSCWHHGCHILRMIRCTSMVWLIVAHFLAHGLAIVRRLSWRMFESNVHTCKSYHIIQLFSMFRTLSYGSHIFVSLFLPVVAIRRLLRLTVTLSCAPSTSPLQLGNEPCHGGTEQGPAQTLGSIRQLWSS
jgi:hypothetical protein